jgi:uncharacterized membrane protein YdjX (TVP38/TMEM64 family)
MIEELISYFESVLTSNNVFIVTFLAFFIVVLESIIPILPLALFISLNMLIFGNVVGFIISWVGTIVGCIISFYIFRTGLSKYVYKYFKITKVINKVDDIKFKNLVLITSLPFTPAFAINIACGLSKMSFKKFLVNILIAKIPIVIFWGYIGSSLLASLTNINDIIKIGNMLLITYYISDYVMKKLNL